MTDKPVAAQPATTPTRERLKFEKWFRSKYCNYVNPFRMFPKSDYYIDTFVGGHFETWIAAVEGSIPQGPPKERQSC